MLCSLAARSPPEKTVQKQLADWPAVAEQANHADGYGRVLHELW